LRYDLIRLEASPLPKRPPDETAIRALASRESFERGRDYWRRGAVLDLVKRGDELTAVVEGSDVAPYQVTIRLHDGGIADMRCTCPYDWGGPCKHIVATLLKFADGPGAVTERPPLRERLQALERDALIDLISRRLATDPDLAGWIEADLAAAPHSARQTPVDPEPIAARAHAVLAGRYRERRYWDDYTSSGDAAELRDLVEKAVPFLETGDGRNALRILEAVTDAFVDDWIEYSSGSDEHMYELFNDLGRMVAEAALMSDLSAEDRDGYAITVADWQDRLGDYGVEEAFGVALRALETGWGDPALQAVLAGQVTTWPAAGAEDWDERALTLVRLRVLDACGRTDAYLNLARAAGATTSVATMLVKLDRVPEAVAYAQAAFTRPGESLDLTKALKAAGRHDEALAIAEAGLRLGRTGRDDDDWSPGRSVAPLAHWLRDEAGAMGRRDLALTAARTAFEQTLSLQDYRAVETWAGENWKTVRKDLLACLTAARFASDRVEILLSEGLIDEAVRYVGGGDGDGTSDAVLLRLMEAAHASQPDWVIRLAERKAARIMEAGSAGLYEVAAQWLQKSALAHDAAGRIDEWTATIEGLIEKHRKKYKLRPLLEALRYDS
jgi:uncharacterized Zn finger protein